VLCLTRPTDPRWAELALRDLDAVLVDHAHCEMKAASNALSLAARSPSFPRVVRALVDLAAEEIAHFRRVLGELDRRGVALGKPPVDAYAAELRKLSSSTAKRRDAEDSLTDRLLVGALIEARSCERFRLLADALAERGQAELAAFYEELFASEARHFRTLCDLAVEVTAARGRAGERGATADDEARVKERLAELARAEGEIVARLGVSATIHG
jgi:tRNA 2-(methylsulfanyl)-N6-isopentenyladenosine37 hydroxylase